MSIPSYIHCKTHVVVVLFHVLTISYVKYHLCMFCLVNNEQQLLFIGITFCSLTNNKHCYLVLDGQYRIFNMNIRQNKYLRQLLYIFSQCLCATDLVFVLRNILCFKFFLPSFLHLCTRWSYMIYDFSKYTCQKNK